MKIIRLERDRVKVFLSDRDLLDMNINLSDLTPDSPELSLFMCEVMDAVREETGFSAEQGQVVVEAAADDDGIVLMLSKIRRTPDHAKVRGIRAVKKNDTVIFGFENFEAFAGLLVNIGSRSIVNMKLYRYNKHLFVAVPRREIPALIYEYALISRRSAVSESIVSEYGEMLAGGRKLMEIARDLKNMR